MRNFGKIKFTATILFIFWLSATAPAQTTAFNYQGRLTEGGNPANGAYQMQFKLFDSLSVGTQIGATLSDVPVTVSNGVFAAKLDFGANALSGANRWLEIAVRHNSSEFYTTLSPREQIASSPYAVRTLSAASADNALQLGGIPASEYVTTSSVNSAFIRNSTEPQSANFNITGSGVLGILGIGTFNPFQLLHIKSQIGFNAASLVEAPTGFFAQYQLQSGATNPWILGTQDNFSGNGLLFRNGGNDLMVVRPTGNVGIGTTTPTARLTINGTGLNGYSLGVSGDVGIGGNVTQTRDRGGMVKAMVFVNGINGSTIARCYNGISGASIPPCGFLAERLGVGAYRLTFPFQVDDRFFSLSTYGGGAAGDTIIGQTYQASPASNASVRIFITESISGGDRDGDFCFIVY